MSAVPTTGLVGHCVVRSRSRDRAAQFGELGAGVLDRAPVGRGAYLVIRRIAVDAASISDRDAALADHVAEAARSASRPHRGHIPSDAVAVLFLDHAEMAATRLLDIARGVAGDHWWWTHLDLRVPRRVAEAVLNDITTAPAALDQLDTWGRGDEVLAAMSEIELASVADAMERTHLHSSMYEASDATDAVPRRDPGVDTAPGARPVRGVGSRRSSPQAERLARVRRVIASQRALTARAGRRPTVTAPAARHRDVSSRAETGESRRHSPLDPADAAPSSATEPGENGRATDPGADVPSVASPDAFRGRIEPSGSPATGTDHPGITDQGRPTASDGETTRLRAGEALAPQRPTTVPVPSVPVHPTESTGFPTQLAGLFYLIGALRAIELPPGSPWGHERWAMLAALVHELIGDTPDPIWQFLRDRAARPDPMEPFPPPALEATAAAALDSINETFDLDDGELAEIVATPGVVYATSTHIDVQIALERISMTARMRGLDADPGWCPELGHVIRFHFEDL